MNKPYRIVIVEDHRILRDGLRVLISSHQDFAVVGEADNGLDAVRRVEELRPDLVLMDLSMPKMSGLDAIVEIKNQCPDTKLLVLTVHKADEYVFEALKAGADGYLLKDASQGELMLAVENILDGRRYISSGISGKLIEGYLAGKKISEPELPLETLTRRERQVLKMIGEGRKNKEIAGLLCISPKTVEKHRANLMRKLDLHSGSALTAFAMEKGLITK